MPWRLVHLTSLHDVDSKGGGGGALKRKPNVHVWYGMEIVVVVTVVTVGGWHVEWSGAFVE